MAKIDLSFYNLKVDLVFYNLKVYVEHEFKKTQGRREVVRMVVLLYCRERNLTYGRVLMKASEG